MSNTIHNAQGNCGALSSKNQQLICLSNLNPLHSIYHKSSRVINKYRKNHLHIIRNSAKKKKQVVISQDGSRAAICREGFDSIYIYDSLSYENDRIVEPQKIKQEMEKRRNSHLGYEHGDIDRNRWRFVTKISSRKYAFGFEALESQGQMNRNKKNLLFSLSPNGKLLVVKGISKVPPYHATKIKRKRAIFLYDLNQSRCIQRMVSQGTNLSSETDFSLYSSASSSVSTTKSSDEESFSSSEKVSIDFFPQDISFIKKNLAEESEKSKKSCLLESSNHENLEKKNDCRDDIIMSLTERTFLKCFSNESLKKLSSSTENVMQKSIVSLSSVATLFLLTTNDFNLRINIGKSSSEDTAKTLETFIIKNRSEIKNFLIFHRMVLSIGFSFHGDMNPSFIDSAIYHLLDDGHLYFHLNRSKYTHLDTLLLSIYGSNFIQTLFTKAYCYIGHKIQNKMLRENIHTILTGLLYCIRTELGKFTAFLIDLNAQQTFICILECIFITFYTAFLQCIVFYIIV